jgi:hypothetical protein
MKEEQSLCLGVFSAGIGVRWVLPPWALEGPSEYGVRHG